MAEKNHQAMQMIKKWNEVTEARSEFEILLAANKLDTTSLSWEDLGILNKWVAWSFYKKLTAARLAVILAGDLHEVDSGYQIIPPDIPKCMGYLSKAEELVASEKTSIYQFLI